MINKVIGCIMATSLVACAGNNKVAKKSEMPACLQKKIIMMQADPNEGSPISVSRYSYRGQTVYYLVSPCCDKYNVVYDSVCNLLGYPDGGFTGKGDGNMIDFKDLATDKKVLWEQNPSQ